ncbi:MAG: hypothetical protein CL873_02150 [Dehalococcoidales bacterium]|jgi:hypothetical protein|nr:hypothetical protein [Dehalococcoidales bacterium]|tara:strand:+ start:382 stop:795 length:414 start_codon:yes stop_codon:yes gene_type:complete
MVIDDAVERCGLLQNQIKELEFRLEEIRQVVIDFCQAQGLNLVYGKEHTITYRTMEKTAFDEEEVRALLQPEGLWLEVLKLDPSRLKQLISEEKLGKGIGKKLEELRRVISSYPQLWVKNLLMKSRFSSGKVVYLMI